MKLQIWSVLAESHLLDSEKDIVERFNQYFATVFRTDPPAMSAASNNSDDPLHR